MAEMSRWLIVPNIVPSGGLDQLVFIGWKKREDPVNTSEYRSQQISLKC